MSLFKSILLVICSFVFGFLGAHVANVVSAHGGNENLVHSCVNNSSGTVKIVGPDDTCNANETPLDWNAQGQAGGNSGLEVVSSQGPTIVPGGGLASPHDFPAGGRWTQSVSCPSGKVALSGGGKITYSGNISDGLGNSLTNSYPVGNPPTGWTVSMIVTDGLPVTLTAYAICVNGS